MDKRIQYIEKAMNAAKANQVQLLEAYPFTCCKCGKEATAAPSVFMLLGSNHGHGHCPNEKCGILFHLSITKEMKGNRMIAEPYSLAYGFCKEIKPLELKINHQKS